MPTLNDEAQIRVLIETRADAIRMKNVQKTLSCFSPELVAFTLAPPLIDKLPLAEGLESWFATWRGDIGNEIRDLQVIAGGNVAYGHCLARLFGTKTDGETSDIWFRETLGFRKLNGQWLITHSHESVPFYMDGSDRAAIDLRP